ncbi:GNAT family N-acetyltransferase [Actinoplanes subtropicus]|uniref:GNAT family N-acetyltransferase n=1 Tax=Actinoplanes subtropicus TaxID=543632 RepID=UPI000AE098E7|nr:GNAT family N-acetyltransferase [Actinoplanes subtropicus]
MAAQPGARIWERPGAVAVARADLYRRDRIAISGEPGAVARLLGEEVLAAVGPTFRPVGDEELVTEVARRLPSLTAEARFGWMEVTAPVPATAGPRWLAEDESPQVLALIEGHFPGSWARPDRPGVRRWAGVRDDDGRLLAVAADAWSTAETGLIAGVATRAEARGRGLARQVCAFVTNELLAGRERVALIVDYWNEPALKAYGKLGFVLRPLAAAAVR